MNVAKVTVVFKNEFAREITISGSADSLRAKLEMIGPDSLTEWSMTRLELAKLKIVVDALNES